MRQNVASKNQPKKITAALGRLRDDSVKAKDGTGAAAEAELKQQREG
jgi:hypothetical protein